MSRTAKKRSNVLTAFAVCTLCHRKTHVHPGAIGKRHRVHGREAQPHRWSKATGTSDT